MIKLQAPLKNVSMCKRYNNQNLKGINEWQSWILVYVIYENISQSYDERISTTVAYIHTCICVFKQLSFLLTCNLEIHEWGMIRNNTYKLQGKDEYKSHVFLKNWAQVPRKSLAKWFPCVCAYICISIYIYLSTY